MKKLGLSIIALMMIVSVLPVSLAAAPEGPVHARAVNRAVLGELATGTWCGWCPSADNAFSNIIDDDAYFPDRFTVIEWHNGDAYTNADSNARNNYYGITSYPTANFDGIVKVEGGSQDVNALTNSYKGKINARPVTAPIDINVSSVIVGTTGYYWINVTGVEAVSLTKLHLRVAVVEDLNTTHNNGKLRWTGRNMTLDQNMTINVSEVTPFSGNYAVQNGWVKEKMGIVAFVQSDATKEVLQSEFLSYSALNKKPVVATSITDIIFAEDTTYTQLDLKTVFSDPDGDPLTYTSWGNSKIAVSIATDGKVTLTPTRDWAGTEVIRFVAKDSWHSSNATATANVTVSPMNDAPVMLRSIYDFSMIEGATKAGVDLDEVFSDKDSTLNFSYSGNSRVTVAINPSTHVVTYTASDLWTGKELITFLATDGQYTLSAPVNVTVLKTNHAPTAGAIFDITMAEDTVNTAIDLTKVFADVDGFDTLTLEYLAPEHINVAVDSSRKVTLTPVANWNGMETVTFTANDGIASPVMSTVNVTVSAVNDVPQVSGKLEDMIFDEDTPYTTTGSLKKVFTDVDGDALTYTAEPSSTGLLVEINTDGTVAFTPANDFFGAVPVIFKAADAGTSAAEYRCNVTVNGINDAPVITANDPAIGRDVNLNEGEEKAFSVTATDVDGDTLTYTWTLDLKAKDETTASFTYKTDYTSAGTHKLSVIVTDGRDRVEKNWNIKVTDVNRKPTLTVASPLAGLVVKSGAPIQFLADAKDLDNDKLTYRWTSDGVEIGTMALFTATLKSGTHKILVEVSDGKETVTSQEITVTVSKAPVAKTQPGFEAGLLAAAIALSLGLLGRRKLEK